MVEEPSTDPAERWKAELEGDVPKRRRGMPLWFWGCGGGCLVFLALFIGGTIWMYSQFMSTTGPEKAWPALAEVMPYGEEPPDGYTPNVIDQAYLKESPLARWFLERAGPAAGDAFVAEGHRILTILENPSDARPSGSGSRVVLWELGPGDAVEDFVPPATFNELVGAPRENEESVTLVLQGREVSGQRSDVVGQNLPLVGEQDIQELLLDITGDRERPLLLRLVSTGEVKATEAELNRVLEPFQVWPEETP